MDEGNIEYIVSRLQSEGWDDIVKDVCYAFGWSEWAGGYLRKGKEVANCNKIAAQILGVPPGWIKSLSTSEDPVNLLDEWLTVNRGRD